MRVRALAEGAIPKGLKECREAGASPVNFVTHSLGGILVRQYYSQHSPEQVHRVVMLGPPNQGSAVVDNLKNVPGFDLLNGPAGRQLGTGENSVPDDLGPVNFETGNYCGHRVHQPDPLHLPEGTQRRQGLSGSCKSGRHVRLRDPAGHAPLHDAERKRHSGSQEFPQNRQLRQ